MRWSSRGGHGERKVRGKQVCAVSSFYLYVCGENCKRWRDSEYIYLQIGPVRHSWRQDGVQGGWVTARGTHAIVGGGSATESNRPGVKPDNESHKRKNILSANTNEKSASVTGFCEHNRFTSDSDDPSRLAVA